MSGEEGESGCWQQSHPLRSFIYLFRHVEGKPFGIPVADPRTSQPSRPFLQESGHTGAAAGSCRRVCGSALSVCASELSAQEKHRRGKSNQPETDPAPPGAGGGAGEELCTAVIS